MPRSGLRTLPPLLLALAACLSDAACRHAPADLGSVPPIASAAPAAPISQPPPASPRLRTTSFSPSAESQALAAVQSRPEYARAAEQVRLGKYRPAIAILKSLSADSGLSTGQREFVLDQIDICRSHLGMPPAARPAVASHPAAGPVRSPEAADCGPQALALVCMELGVKADAAKLRVAAGTTGEGTSMAGMVRAAKSVGLKAEGVRVNRAALGEVKLPAIALVSQPGAPSGHHYVVVERITGTASDGMATIRDPGDSRTRQVQRESLLRRSSGLLLLVSRA